ncbi:MAG TPA: FlgD immunoglobulin-like domain containing protein [Thermoanaerobaculia bacterium]|nr:FlgD immunoglobulin-like domain containing protein [Thermoanaerobaculia bacterium]
MRNFLTAVFLWALATAAAAAPPVFRSLAVSPASVNPSLGEEVELVVTLERAGSLRATVVDRDGYPVRTIADGPAVAGPNRYRWNGRAADGAVVPDEAYSFLVDWTSGGETSRYFPANAAVEMRSIDSEYYAERTATLAYVLPVPSRVHIQAGVARRNAKTGAMDGPVMKTIVNREPRGAGRIGEPWNGFDESGLVKIAALRDFVVAIAATPLPENSVITYGNRGRSFAEVAVQRTGRSLFTHHVASHAHHAGLTALEDISPGMRLEPVNAVWSNEEGAWRVDGKTLRLKVTLTGPAASTFAKQPGDLHRFVDGTPVGKASKAAGHPAELQVPLRSGVTQNVSVNWRSQYGAVAANTIRVRVEGVR